MASRFASSAFAAASTAKHLAETAYHSSSSFFSSLPAELCCKLRFVLMSAISARVSLRRRSYLEWVGGVGAAERRKRAGIESGPP